MIATRGPRPRGWSRPEKRTTDRGRFLTSLTCWSAFTVAGTAPESHRLPFEPPPPDVNPWAAPWSANLLGVSANGCQIGQYFALPTRARGFMQRL